MAKPSPPENAQVKAFRNVPSRVAVNSLPPQIASPMQTLADALYNPQSAFICHMKISKESETQHQRSAIFCEEDTADRKEICSSALIAQAESKYIDGFLTAF